MINWAVRYVEAQQPLWWKIISDNHWWLLVACLTAYVSASIRTSIEMINLRETPIPSISQHESAGKVMKDMNRRDKKADLPVFLCRSVEAPWFVDWRGPKLSARGPAESGDRQSDLRQAQRSALAHHRGRVRSRHLQSIPRITSNASFVALLLPRSQGEKKTAAVFGYVLSMMKIKLLKHEKMNRPLNHVPGCEQPEVQAFDPLACFECASAKPAALFLKNFVYPAILLSIYSV